MSGKDTKKVRYAVGDKVKDKLFGTGVVIRIEDEEKEIYPLVVKFKRNVFEAYYTLDGKFFGKSDYPNLEITNKANITETDNG